VSVDREELRRTYADHVARLSEAYAEALDAVGFAAVALHSGALQKRAEADDQYWPLRPVPHFAHWLPLVAPDCALVVEPGRRPRLVWVRPETFWERLPLPESDHWQEQFDIVEVKDADEVRRYLPREAVAIVGERRSPPTAWRHDGPLNPPALVERLDRLRTRKSPYEVLCIAEANRRAAAGHRSVAEAFLTGDWSELDLHLLFLRATRQDDPETPYKNIVALGANAATLHHVDYGRIARSRPVESLLIDAAAGYLGYAADVTRTHVKGSGSAAEAFTALRSRVERMQQRLCAEVEVGLPFPALHERAHAYVAEILHDLGLVRLPPAEIVAAGVTRAFFPHGLGHSLGLQTHDVGCSAVQPTEENDWLRNTSVIEPDQVFTIEPGIYFIEARLARLRAGPHAGAVDWRLVEELAGLGGVRIEDDVRVLPAVPGAPPVVNLTRAHLP
jgi:Xaa-Pro dipeptidase